MREPFTGRCACGAIRYECSSGPAAKLSCHCRDCQRASGGAGSFLVVVPESRLRVTGEPKYHVSEPEPGKPVRRGFCGQCGSPMFLYVGSLAGRAFITAGSLDDPSRFKPMVHIWTASAQPWDFMNPAIPRFPKAPPRTQ